MATKQSLKKFRADIAKLKKKGLISPTIDARSAAPGLHGGAALKKKIAQYQDVLSGKAGVAKLSASELHKYKIDPAYQSSGYRFYKDKIIVPKAPVEKVRTTRSGHLTFINPSGIERVQLPCPYHSLRQYLACLKKNRREINRMKKEDEYWGFRFFGNNSSSIYRDIGHLLEDLIKYDDLDKSFKSKRAKDQAEVYQNLEIVKIHRRDDWQFPERVRSRRKQTPESRRRAYARMPQFKKDQLNKKKADAQRKARAAKKGNK